MSERSPGLNQRRLVRLMRAAITACGLDLHGLRVLTEAASGAYVVTPVIAALAGAEVTALTRSTAYGSVEAIRGETMVLAELAGVASRVRVTGERQQAHFAEADIVTNSGHVRPIDETAVASMRPGAALPLMYESWEYREADLDLGACRARGVLVAGTNERHPAVDVFGYLGVMAVRLLHQAGVAVYGNRVLLLCDNDFGAFIQRGLSGAGAEVRLAAALAAADLEPAPDAVLVALRPQGLPVFDAAAVNLLAEAAPGAVLAQYWGDIDRAAVSAAGLPIWPLVAPAPGHMAILPSAVGPEPIVRLQAGGLKVGAVLARGLGRATAGDLAFVQLMT